MQISFLLFDNYILLDVIAKTKVQNLTLKLLRVFKGKSEAVRLLMPEATNTNTVDHNLLQTWQFCLDPVVLQSLTRKLWFHGALSE